MSMKCSNLLNPEGRPYIQKIEATDPIKLDSVHAIPDFGKPPKNPNNLFYFIVIVLLLIDIGLNVYCVFWR